MHNKSVTSLLIWTIKIAKKNWHIIAYGNALDSGLCGFQKPFCSDRGAHFRKINPSLFARFSLPWTEIRSKHNEGVHGVLEQGSH